MAVQGDFVADLDLAGFQHAIQTAQRSKRDRHAAVLRRTVWVEQEVSDVPDDITLLLDGFCVFHRFL